MNEFITTLVEFLKSSGLPAEAKSHHIVVCGCEFQVSATRAGSVRFLGTVYRRLKAGYNYTHALKGLLEVLPGAIKQREHVDAMIAARARVKFIPKLHYMNVSVDINANTVIKIEFKDQVAAFAAFDLIAESGIFDVKAEVDEEAKYGDELYRTKDPTMTQRRMDDIVRGFFIGAGDHLKYIMASRAKRLCEVQGFEYNPPR